MIADPNLKVFPALAICKSAIRSPVFFLVMNFLLGKPVWPVTDSLG